ncbi:hypothetical protein [Streptomyces sp. NPDC097619]|uniref:hypothetical protein n=1 Tax=Streptomyces sp. NPDC097619 TaxID=3157228 RepID=UPI00333260FB
MLAETICSAVAAAGLGLAAVTAYRRRFLAATRTAAYALVPLGLVLTGVVEWAAGIVFKPTVWAGFGVLGLAWVLFVVTRAVERRRSGGELPEAAGAAKAGRGKGRGAVAPGAASPALGGGRPAAAPAASTGRAAGSAAPEEDFSDIEAILKKHGI